MTAKEFTVYKHTTPNGKVYIGITSKKNINDRFQGGKGYKGCRLFAKAIEKYGWDNILHEVLLQGLSREEACKKEIELIAKYKATDPRYGYNLCRGGNLTTLGMHFTLSEEHKQKLREIAYWRTHKITEETKRKMSIAKTGKPAPNRKAILCIETNQVYKSVSEAAVQHNLCRSSISNCLTGRAKTAGGYRWTLCVDYEQKII